MILFILYVCQRVPVAGRYGRCFDSVGLEEACRIVLHNVNTVRGKVQVVQFETFYIDWTDLLWILSGPTGSLIVASHLRMTSMRARVNTGYGNLLRGYASLRLPMWIRTVISKLFQFIKYRLGQKVRPSRGTTLPRLIQIQNQRSALHLKLQILVKCG